MIIRYDGDSSIFQHYDLIVGDFYATWCKPCTSYETTLNNVHKKIADQQHVGNIPAEKFAIIKIDIEQHMQFCVNNNIQSVPTTIIWHKQQKVEQWPGAPSETALTEILTKYTI